MLTVDRLSFGYGKKILFKDVNLKFTAGNCYGIIGANGSGKSTFLKILDHTLDSDAGGVSIPSGQRLSVLQQNQSAFDEYRVEETVLMGYKKLYQLEQQRTQLYSKEDFTEEDGLKAADLENEYADLGGYEAQSQIGQLLTGLGLSNEDQQKNMLDLDSKAKVRVLLAQALFAQPDILLLDEPTNNLDLQSIEWLTEFLINFPNIVIVVSHNRHFLNQVCTHIVDIDYQSMQMYVGNYDFWYQASQLIAKQKNQEKRKAEDKANELKSFIQRFGSNASKAKQATSRKKLLDKLDLSELPHSSRRFPYIHFDQNQALGKSILNIHKAQIPGMNVPFDLQVNPQDKIAFIGPSVLISGFFSWLWESVTSSLASVRWGSTVKPNYLPKDPTTGFENNEETILDFLRPWSQDQSESFIRGFLGRMLFSQQEALKTVNVLSGGEKVRVMLCLLMLSDPNFLILDDPTNHLDLETITSFNQGLEKFNGCLFLSSHDYEFLNTTANRVIELNPQGYIDRQCLFEEFMHNPAVLEQRKKWGEQTWEL